MRARSLRGRWCLVLAVAVLVLPACDGKHRRLPTSMRSDASVAGESTTQALPLDTRPGVGNDVRVSARGVACESNSGCASGYCVDGVFS